jgi:hypothetical protein
MNTFVFAQGVSEGMKASGATFVKMNNTHFFFEIQKGSVLDNEDARKRVNDFLLTTYGRGMKFKIV